MAHTKGMDFSVEDHLDSNKFNHVVWTGTMGNKPYPSERNGADLSVNRAELLRTYHLSLDAQAAGVGSKVATNGSK